MRKPANPQGSFEPLLIDLRRFTGFSFRARAPGLVVDTTFTAELVQGAISRRALPVADSAQGQRTAEDRPLLA